MIHIVWWIPEATQKLCWTHLGYHCLLVKSCHVVSHLCTKWAEGISPVIFPLFIFSLCGYFTCSCAKSPWWVDSHLQMRNCFHPRTALPPYITITIHLMYIYLCIYIYASWIPLWLPSNSHPLSSFPGRASRLCHGLLTFRSSFRPRCGSIPAVLVLCIDWSQELSQAEQERCWCWQRSAEIQWLYEQWLLNPCWLMISWGITLHFIYWGLK